MVSLNRVTFFVDRFFDDEECVSDLVVFLDDERVFERLLVRNGLERLDDFDVVALDFGFARFLAIILYNHINGQHVYR